jgi:hypothetical protein
VKRGCGINTLSERGAYESEYRSSEGKLWLFSLMIQLVLKLFLDYVPAFLCMGNDAPGAILESGGQDTEVARTGEKKKRAVAEEA